MADVKHAQTLQTVEAGGANRRVIVHLELENVRSLAHLAENSHNDAFGAQQGISTVLTGFTVREELKVDVCGPISFIAKHKTKVKQKIRIKTSKKPPTHPVFVLLTY